jgi:hypothetical protein
MTGGIEHQRMLEARIIPGLLQSIEHDSKQTQRRLASELGPERVIVPPLLGLSEQVEGSQRMEQPAGVAAARPRSRPPAARPLQS